MEMLSKRNMLCESTDFPGLMLVRPGKVNVPGFIGCVQRRNGMLPPWPSGPTSTSLPRWKKAQGKTNSRRIVGNAIVEVPSRFPSHSNRNAEAASQALI